MYVICERAERASLENFRIFTFLNCYFPQYFVGTSDTLFQKHLISGVNILHTYTINAVFFYYSRYGAICINVSNRQNTNIEKMYVYATMRASGSSELRKFRYFYILKLISFNILSVRQILCRYK